MTLREIELREFKCFSHLVLPVSPLTILTGFNAAGKSTTLQSLLLMAQSMRLRPNEPYVLLNGPLVRLGNASDVAAVGGAGSIELSFRSDHAGVLWRFEAVRSKDRRLKLSEARYQVNGDVILGPADSLIPAGGCPRELSDLLETIKNVVFLGASRMSRVEAYPSPDDGVGIHADVGEEGEYAAWWWSENADDEVDAARRHPLEDRLTIRGQVDAYLSDLFPGAQASVDQFARTALSRLDLKMGRGDWRKPANIGFGISYAFPIVVALLLAKPGQIVVIDSPEAHLHPRAQSVMGKLLSRFASAGIQIIVETHSDHLLSGIRLGVRENLIEPSAISLHFFRNRDDSSVDVVSPIIDRNATVSEWPEGFFDQSERDLAILAGWHDS